MAHPVAALWGNSPSNSPNPAGRPRRKDRKIGPIQLELIQKWHLQGRTLRQMARDLGVDHKTVEHHIRRTILPEIRQRAQEELSIELARIDRLMSEAWQGYRRSQFPAEDHTVTRATTGQQRRPASPLTSTAEALMIDRGVPATEITRTRKRLTRDGSVAWLDIVRWCIEQKLKIFGWYAKTAAKVPAQPPEQAFVAKHPPASPAIDFITWTELEAELKRKPQHAGR